MSTGIDNNGILLPEAIILVLLLCITDSQNHIYVVPLQVDLPLYSLFRLFIVATTLSESTFYNND